MKIMGGLAFPTSGELKMYGSSDEKGLNHARTRMSFMIETPYAKEKMSAKENLEKQRLQKGIPDKKRIDEVLEIIGMSDKRKLTPRELSGGQQQRVAIARALVFDPDIIFLDEPIGNLDSKTGMKIMELFREINQKLGKTIVQVTHSEESARYGTKLVRVLDGQIESIEEVSEMSPLPDTHRGATAAKLIPAGITD